MRLIFYLFIIIFFFLLLLLLLVGYPLSAVHDFGLELNNLFRLSMDFLSQLRCNGTETSLSQCQLDTVTFSPSISDVAAVQCVG